MPFRFTIITLSLGTLLMGSALLASSAQAQGERLDGIVAIVGTHPILHSDVEAMAMAIARGSRPGQAERQAALDELITLNVVAEKALRDTTIIIREDEVSGALDERINELVRQLGSEDAVRELYGRTLAQLREDHRSEVRRQLAAQTLQRRVLQNVRITPHEVRAWFGRIPQDSLPMIPELVRIAHIVQFPDIEAAARETALERIEAIRDSILAGESFEELARRHTDDPGSRDAGGRYRSINVNDLVPEFGAVAASLQPGEISHVFETQFGYHVLRLNDMRGDLMDFNHILISVDQSRVDPAAAIGTLETLRDSVIHHGASFARLARNHSADQASAPHGGNVLVPQTGERDLRLEALSPQWRATIETIGEGEVSEPRQVTLLDGRQAYHIVLLQRRVPAHRMSLDTDWALAEEFALQNKRQEVFFEWLDGVRREVYVSCKDEAICPPDAARTTARR